MEQNKEKAITSVKKHIAELKTAAAVIADPLLGNQLVTKYAEMYEVPVTEAQRFYNREKDSFGKLISQSPALQQCTPMSAYLAFGFVMKYRASFDTGRGATAYLIPGRRNIGSKDQPNMIWEMVASLTADGEREARIHRIGQKNSAQISYFLGKDTIDEKIYKIIESKRDVADAITGTTTDISTIITDLTASLFNQR